MNITVREVIFAAKGSSAILYRSLELRDINFTPPQTGRVVFTHHYHLILIPDQNPALICMQILIENGHTDLMLTEQIHNRIEILAGFYLGTKSTIEALANCCRLAYELYNPIPQDNVAIRAYISDAAKTLRLSSESFNLPQFIDYICTVNSI